MLDKKQIKQLEEKLLNMSWRFDREIDTHYIAQQETVENKSFRIIFENYVISEELKYKKTEFREENGSWTDITFLVSEKLAKKIYKSAYDIYQEECNKLKEELIKAENIEKEKTAKRLMEFLGE